jgi:hypothetical protein
MNKLASFLFILILVLFIQFRLNSQNTSWEWVITSNDPENENPRAITTSSNGDVYIAGEFEGTLSLQGNTIDAISGTLFSSAYLAKFDSNGDFIWSFAIGGNGSIVSVLRDVATDSEGNCYLGGKILSQATELIVADSALTLPGGTFNQTFIAKVNPNGELIWITYINPISESGIFSEVLFVDVNSNDELFVSGQIQGTYNFGAQLVNTNNLYSGFLTKMDKNSGEFIWVNTLDANDSYSFSDIITTNDGRIFISGSWAGDTLFAGNQFLINNLPLVGDNYDSFVVSYSSEGEIQLMERHHSPNNEYGGVFTKDEDDNIYIHYTIDETLNVNNNLINGPGLVRYAYIADAPAQLSWIIPGFDEIGSAYYGDYDSQGNLFYGGSFVTESIQIGDFTFTNAGEASGTSDIYLFSVNSNGEIYWATAIGGIENEILYKINIGSNDNVNICGTYVSPSFSIGSFNLTNSGDFTENLFLASLNNPLSINDLNSFENICVFPNPADNAVNIQLDNENGSLIYVEIFDLCGKSVYSTRTNNPQTIMVNTSNLVNGSYIINVISNKNKSTNKLIINR